MARATFSPNRVLLVHAHPDDESLFTGHVIADRIAAGASVFVFTLTRGERGRMKLEELKALEGKHTQMGAFRTTELHNALNALSSDENKVQHEFAGTRAYLDSGMRIDASGRPAKRRNLDPMSLVAVSTAVIADDIENVLKRFKPDAVITYNRKGGYGHPDHKRAFEATSMALRHYNKGKRTGRAQLWVIAEPRERYDAKIGGHATAAKKRAALEAHASQVIVNQETYALTPEQNFRYDEPERLRKTAPSTWLVVKPWVKALWGLPLGVLVAFLGTMLHQTTANDATHVPIGLILALALVGSLSLALRMLRNSRGALYLMALGFWVTLYNLGLQQPGSEIFIPNNTNGLYWAWGSSGLLAIVLLFPRLRRATWSASANGHR